MCPTPDGVTRPPHWGLAGKGGFFNNLTYKKCTWTCRRGRPFEWRWPSSYFWGRAASALILVILSKHALLPTKQQTARFMVLNYRQFFPPFPSRHSFTFPWPICRKMILMSMLKTTIIPRLQKPAGFAPLPVVTIATHQFSVSVRNADTRSWSSCWSSLLPSRTSRGLGYSDLFFDSILNPSSELRTITVFIIQPWQIKSRIVSYLKKIKAP